MPASPPSMEPPPGYVGYAPTAFGQVPQLRRIGGLSKWLVATTAIVAIVTLTSIVTSLSAVQDARDFLAGRISKDEFEDAYAPTVLLAGVQSIAVLATVVLTIVWMFRITANHRALGRIGSWSPGWAIGGWFLPPLVLYVIPYLMLRELWRASNPEVPIGDDRWRPTPVHAVVTVWWVLYGLAPIVIMGLQGADALNRGLGSGDAEDLAEVVDDQVGLTVASGVLTIAAAIAWVVLVRGLTARHSRLTGESAARS
jgi:Domain of unknown function (DUF4328)